MALSSYQQLQQVKDQYDSIGQHFAQTRRKKMWPEIIPFIKKIKTGQRVLDVGCGSGRLLSELKNKEFYYTGIDFSATLLEQAKNDYPKKRFLKRDVTDPNQWQGVGLYDHVFSLGVLHHIASRKRQHDLLAQMFLHTKPGGLVTISIWNLYNKRFFPYHLRQIGKKIEYGNPSFIWYPYSVSDGKKTIKKVMRFCKAYLPGEILRLVKQVGYSVETYYYAKKGKTYMSILDGENFVIHGKRKG